MSARELVKEYGGVRAVDGVSVEISEGETLGLVGESGSGKSTLSRLILGLEKPTSGYVQIAEINVTQASASEMRSARRQMQVVFQDPVGSLNRRKTAEQSIASPLEIYGVPKPERRARVRELLELVGLNDGYRTRYPATLSGGQCQRVGIARALALEPKFVVLDEAVSALDVSVRSQILNLLRELQSRLGLTYLFVSHDLAVVRYMAPRIAVMYKGRIVEERSRETIFSTPEHAYTASLIAAIPTLNAV